MPSKKKEPCKHEGNIMQKLGCVICAKCRFIIYHGGVKPEDKKRLIT